MTALRKRAAFVLVVGLLLWTAWLTTRTPSPALLGTDDNPLQVTGELTGPDRVRFELRVSRDGPGPSERVFVKGGRITVLGRPSPDETRVDIEEFPPMDVSDGTASLAPGHYQLEVFESSDGIQRPESRTCMPFFADIHSTSGPAIPLHASLKRFPAIVVKVRSSVSPDREHGLLRFGRLSGPFDRYHLRNERGGRYIKIDGDAEVFDRLERGKYWIGYARRRNEEAIAWREVEVSDGQVVSIEFVAN